MIDGGLARTGRSSDRQPVYRAEAVRAQAESQPPVEQPVRERPTKAQPPMAPRRAKGRGGWIAGLVIFLLLAAAAATYFFLPGIRSTVATEIDTSKYQAVFFSNGQVYFGKLEVLNGQYYKLNDAFYVQADAAAGEGDTQSAQTITSQKLIKRGGEVYGPESQMIIDRDQVMFFENLRPDSQVSQLMRDYK